VSITENDLLWIDLETTGLDAQDDVPLELGLAISDEWGQIKCRKTWLIFDEKFEHWNKKLAEARTKPFIGEIHTKSGLFDAIDKYAEQRRGMVWTITDADENAMRWLVSNNVPGKVLPLCGNSIGSLDRPFVLNWFPKLNEYGSYRNIDVSSFKETCRRVNPELFNRLKEVADNKENARHRVQDDIDASIVEYQAYLDNFFFTSLGD
jgi:oligoribonuclease